ncbi:MAG: hypothetical protein ABJB47_01095 [Actinomycetota bacterium]
MGTSNAFRQIGTASGIAVMGSICAAHGGLASSHEFVTGLTAALTVSAVILTASVLIVFFAPGAPRRADSPPDRSGPVAVRQRV